MTFTDPIDFDEAIAKLQAKGLLPTELGTAALRQNVSSALRDRSFFSARVLSAQLLQAFKDAAMKIVKGESNVAQQRLALKDLLDSMDYRPEEGTEGTLTDLSSNARLNLMLKTNVGTVSGWGQWLQGNRPGALDAFPAQELIRVADRKIPREWQERWAAALEDCGQDEGATDGSDRMVALKNHPIWQSLGDGAGGYDEDALGNPFPPFAFNSGMGVEDIGFSEAVDLGVMEEGDEPLQPEERALNDGMEASLENLDPEFQHVVTDGLSSFVHLVDGTLKFKNDAQQIRNRASRLLQLLEEAA